MRPLSARSAVYLNRCRGGSVAGKKDYDATKQLPPDEPTQVTPKRETALGALRRVGKRSSLGNAEAAEAGFPTARRSLLLGICRPAPPFD
jgi:hypothetical protein